MFGRGFARGMLEPPVVTLSVTELDVFGALVRRPELVEAWREGLGGIVVLDGLVLLLPTVTMFVETLGW